MRRMFFALTTPQFRARTKSVTRRLGWWDLKPGDLVMGIEKGMGLPKGSKHALLGPIRIVSVVAEPLDIMHLYEDDETSKEGFPELSVSAFIRMFCASHRGCTETTPVNRIEFEYLD